MDQKSKQNRVIAGMLLVLIPLSDAIADSLAVAQGGTLTVDSNTVMTVNSYGNMNGTLNNYGRINLDPEGDSYIGGIVNNHGFIDIHHSAFSILGGTANGSNRKIINHADGTIMMNGYIDMYSPGSWLENAGRFIVTRFSNYGLTAGLMRGTIKNTGFMQLEGATGDNACPNAGILNFINEGYLEITDQSLCDFGAQPEASYMKTKVVQNSGETRVNGTLGAHRININGGTISGKGVVQGNFEEWPLFDTVTLSPGADIGSLRLSPDEHYLMCVRCSVDIEIAATNQADKLIVDGEFYMTDWKLNVMLRNGYVPAPGTQFTVVSAGLVYYYGADPALNLPELPGGRTWNVQNTGTEVILTAN